MRAPSTPRTPTPWPNPALIASHLRRTPSHSRLQADPVARHGGDDAGAVGARDPDPGNTQDDDPVRDHADEDGADERRQVGAAPAADARPADRAGRDHL